MRGEKETFKLGAKIGIIQNGFRTVGIFIVV